MDKSTVECKSLIYFLLIVDCLSLEPGREPYHFSADERQTHKLNMFDSLFLGNLQITIFFFPVSFIYDKITF